MTGQGTSAGKVLDQVRLHAGRTGLVPLRGLWDKFAPPDTLAAHRRTIIKGLPVLVDLSRTSLRLSDVVALLASTELPLIVVTDGTKSARVLVPELAGVASLVVERSSQPPFDVYVLQGGTPELCGLYFPLLAEPRFSAREKGGTSLLFYESSDTEQRLEINRVRRLPDDREVARLLSALVPEALILKVSDLVDCQLLMRVQREW